MVAAKHNTFHALIQDNLCDVQDYQLSGGSVARTRERIQCFCEGAAALLIVKPTVVLIRAAYPRVFNIDCLAGGHACHSEDPSYQLARSPFQGLHASWVTPQVPSTKQYCTCFTLILAADEPSTALEHKASPA